jgi:hypothetical protein
VALKSTAEHSLEGQWQRLDPIFIIGSQRTGTSIIWRALRTANFLGFNEGHLWLDLVESFARFRDPDHKKQLRQSIFTLGSDRNLVLEKRWALMIDRFHRDLLPPRLVRWVDKSPGVHAVQMAPMLSQLFPRAQFIFMKRNAISTVNSGISYVSREQDLDAFRRMCTRWVHVMRTWRKLSHLLVGRYIELEQERVAERPYDIGQEVAAFLRVPEHAEDFGTLFDSRRENTAFPDREPGDYAYPVDWSDAQEAILSDLCGAEMRVWGYPLDFQSPGGADPAQAEPRFERDELDMQGYYGWVGRVTAEERITRCEEELARIRGGRVMRFLIAGERVLRQIGLR